jgi:hypothetical protein
VVIVRVADALLESGPRGGGLPVCDPESGQRAVVRGAGRVAPQAVPPGIDLIQIDTGHDYLPAVRAMLEGRERRRAR